MAPWAMPTAWAPIVGRLRLSVFMAMVKPSPSSPMRFSTGTRAPSSSTSPVGLPRTPILSSSLPMSRPMSRSTTKHDTPRLPASGSVLANTM